MVGEFQTSKDRSGIRTTTLFISCPSARPVSAQLLVVISIAAVKRQTARLAPPFVAAHGTHEAFSSTLAAHFKRGVKTPRSPQTKNARSIAKKYTPGVRTKYARDTQNTSYSVPKLEDHLRKGCSGISVSDL